MIFWSALPFYFLITLVLIDLDSQASLTISVGMEPLEVPKTIVDVLKKDGVPIRECVQKINDRLHIVTSIIDLAPMEMEMLSRASREKILDRALKPIKDSYDYILISRMLSCSCVKPRYAR